MDMLLRFIDANSPAGIDSIEQLARTLESDQVQTSGNPMLTADEEREILTRMRVRSKFNKTLGGKLESTVLKSLKKLFFEILYPAPVPAGR